MHFETAIRASPEAVWDAIVDDKKFREWTSVFHEGSYFEGDWEKGNRIRFLTLNEKGEKEGLVSEIAESRKYSFISIRHLGYVLGGAEDTTSDAVKNWAPAYENYALTPVGEATILEVDVDVEDRFFDAFSETWPKALEKLKRIAERS